MPNPLVGATKLGVTQLRYDYKRGTNKPQHRDLDHYFLVSGCGYWPPANQGGSGVLLAGALGRPPAPFLATRLAWKCRGRSPLPRYHGCPLALYLALKKLPSLKGGAGVGPPLPLFKR